MFELTENNAPEYLVNRGLITSPSYVQVESLGGGVSNIVLSVRSPQGNFVVKQALPKLRVKDDWFADQTRIFREKACIEALARILNEESVPEVLFEDQENFLMAMSMAPEGSTVYKSLLMAGDASPSIAARAGEMLGRIHNLSSEDSHLREQFIDPETFLQLRVNPYYSEISKAHPELKSKVEAVVFKMLKTKQALVHGDYSPKNMLVKEEHIFLIDFEVVHYGDPTFDSAFFLNHLFLKAFKNPNYKPLYFNSIEHFWKAYTQDLAFADPVRLEESTVRQLGCLMLARIDGKSPVEYINEGALRERVRLTSKKIIREDFVRLKQVLDLVEANLKGGIGDRE